MTEVPVRRTPWTTASLLAAYADAWREVIGGEPSRAALAILYAQATLECGHGGASCFNHNTGNIMALGGYAGDYHVLRGAPECFDAGRVPDGWREAPSNVACGPGKVAAVPVNGSKFRAYASLTDGCADKLRVLDRQWGRAIVALQAATGPEAAAAYVAGLLGPPRYFTGSESTYANTLRSLASSCLSTTPDADWPTPPARLEIPPPPVPVEVPQAVDVVSGLADEETV